MVGFIALLGATLSGIAGLGPWAIAISALSLFATSRATFADLYRTDFDTGERALLFRSITLKSIANAVIAASIAFSGGVALRLLA